jgi:hypothetical protein
MIIYSHEFTLILYIYYVGRISLRLSKTELPISPVEKGLLCSENQ